MKLKSRLFARNEAKSLLASRLEFSNEWIFNGGSTAEWSACQTHDLAVPGSSASLTTTWICFLVSLSSNPQPLDL